MVEYRYGKKVTLAGEGAVGKTSLIRKFVLDQFSDDYLVTFGVKPTKKDVVLTHPKLKVRVEIAMVIWDIMGQKGVRKLLEEAYFAGSNGVLAVCDITRRETLEALENWIHGIKKAAGNVPIVFLVNKCDLKSQATITEEDITTFASRYNAPYFFCSAKTGENVERAFVTLGELMLA